ncbi:hypothetical protein HYV49_04085 [Candidatus Pacearchaeota archaeon]|nr:hypothetical protein [Candidatus Pacearchaeota archaeon]
MNLGEALSLLKKEKSRLARLISLRKENTYLEKGKKNEFDLDELSKDIEEKIGNIRLLKISIQKTNLNTKIMNEKISLAEAIIKVGDLRSKIAELSRLFERKRDSWYYDKDKKEMIAQLDESEIEDEIEKLEIEKTKLDNMIQMTNWNTKIE